MYSRVPPLFCRYGKHLSKEQVAELVAPHPDTLALVNSWLQYNGVPSSSISVSHGGDWLTLAGVPVSQANDLLGASYELYQHTKTKETIIRTVGYALPAVLHAHVRTVAPTTLFASKKTLEMTPRPVGAAANVNAASGEFTKVLSSRDPKDVFYVTPDYLRWLYDTFHISPSRRTRTCSGLWASAGNTRARRI
jgi:tripeptidyl-peptidase-1